VNGLLSYFYKSLKGIACLSAGLLAACATTTIPVPGAENVLVATFPVPQMCSFQGDVKSKHGNAFTYGFNSVENNLQDAVVDLQNQAIALAANYVQLKEVRDAKEEENYNNNKFGIALYGAAFWCPASVLERLDEFANDKPTVAPAAASAATSSLTSAKVKVAKASSYSPTTKTTVASSAIPFIIARIPYPQLTGVKAKAVESETVQAATAKTVAPQASQMVYVKASEPEVQLLAVWIPLPELVMH